MTPAQAEKSSITLEVLIYYNGECRMYKVPLISAGNGKAHFAGFDTHPVQRDKQIRIAVDMEIVKETA